MSNTPSLATGAALTPETWADFVQRLRHDCNGEGVRSHHTAAALFTVQQQKITYGYEPDYAEGLCVYLDDSVWFSPKEYWDGADEEERAELHRLANEESGDGEGFLALSERDQWDVLGELDDHTVTGWNKRWEIVNSHFTNDAAEAFIRRKQHDYGRLRVYVESQYYAWEFEAIKEAIIAGRLVLADAADPAKQHSDGVNIQSAPPAPRPAVPPKAPPPPRR